jgi:YggT family protein
VIIKLPGKGSGPMGLFVNLIIDFLIVLLLIRLFIRPNEAFFNPIFGIIYRITDPIIAPFRYIVRTSFQGTFLALFGLIIIRGLLYPLLREISMEAGIGVSLMEFFDLLFKIYMVILIVSFGGRIYHGSLLMQIAVRAFLPIYNIASILRIKKENFNIFSFFAILILHIIVSMAGILLIAPQLLEGPVILLNITARSIILILRLANFFTLVIIAGALLSWVSPDPRNPIVQAIYAISEPILSPFRRFTPTIGGIDISPIFAIIALQLIGIYGEIIMKKVTGAMIHGLL